MKVFLPNVFDQFLKNMSLGKIVNEAVISIRSDSITTRIQNYPEKTLLVYGSIDYDGSKLDLPDLEYKTKTETFTEKRYDLGLPAIDLLQRVFSSLEQDDSNKVQCQIDTNAILLADQQSTYRIILCYPDIIHVPPKLKPLSYPVEFTLDKKEVDVLMKGMSNISEDMFSVIQENGEAKIKIGIDITNNYIKTIVNESAHDQANDNFEKFFMKDHVYSILGTSKYIDGIKFGVSDKIMKITVEDKLIGMKFEYYLSPKVVDKTDN